MTTRIAMWSGPRNISTAMMRSFENRPDFAVVDEPFYAYYLAQTQSPHPMFDEVLASQPNHYEDVVSALTTAPCATPYEYQKLMTHHMLPGCSLDWTSALKHCFLIRHPALVIASYVKSRGVCEIEDIGIVRQYELYEHACNTSEYPVSVVDSDRLLADPQQILTKLCTALDIPFSEAMLKWPKGRRDSDGVWASHWYASVEDSTGFGAPKHAIPELAPQYQGIADQLMPYYDKMRAQSL